MNSENFKETPLHSVAQAYREEAQCHLQFAGVLSTALRDISDPELARHTKRNILAELRQASAYGAAAARMVEGR